MPEVWILTPDSSTTTTSTAMTSTNLVWGYWTNSTNSTMTSTNLVWGYWTNSTNSTTTSSITTRYYIRTDQAWEDWQALTPTGRASIRAARGERDRQQREARIERRVVEAAAAKDRARELLKLILSTEQWAAYEASQEFYVVAASGRRYLVKHGTQGNLKLIENEVVTESLCVHPPLAEQDDEGHWRNLPTEDVLVAQVLALRHDEDDLRRTANITRVRR